MTILVTAFLLASVIAIFAAMVGSHQAMSGNRFRSKPLLSDNEKEFYARLSQALPDCHVLTQVALGALIQPCAWKNNREYYQARGRFSQKIADYVICTEQWNVLAIVELDDKTHRKNRDLKRDAMLAQAGYTVVRWDSRKKPTVEQIRDRLRATNFEPKPER